MLHGLLDFMLIASLLDEQVIMAWSPRAEPSMKFVRPWAQKVMIRLNFFYQVKKQNLHGIKFFPFPLSYNMIRYLREVFYHFTFHNQGPRKNDF